MRLQLTLLVPMVLLGLTSAAPATKTQPTTSAAVASAAAPAVDPQSTHVTTVDPDEFAAFLAANNATVIPGLRRLAKRVHWHNFYCKFSSYCDVGRK
ncbi:hypothetical protein MMC14_006645 [Varicellaria rhodocarpa]|nr:hypothetical protein [Varicellaria rhodocarpa]